MSGDRPVAGSQHGGLLARLAAARDELHLDLQIPRVEPPIVVRYAPLHQKLADKLNADARKGARADADATITLNARLLVRCCRGIYMLDAAGEPVSIFDDTESVDPTSDDLPNFGSTALIEALGDGISSAVGVVRAMYLTDGDVLAASIDLQEWSAKNGEAIVAKQQEALDPEG